jgi:NAD(P)H dehydrogenase (quinone)
MSNHKVKKVLIVVANPENPQDKRGSLVNDLAVVFAEGCIQAGIEVDFLDLYKDAYNPIHYPHRRDTQTIEYQLRIKKVDMIAFFHPVWWGGLPAILKGFVDKVFMNGYAYETIHGTQNGLLNKRSLVVSVGRYSNWKMKYFFNNTLEIMWRRIIFDIVKLTGDIVYFGNYREVNEGEINRWHKRVRHMAETINEKNSIFELV